MSQHIPESTIAHLSGQLAALRALVQALIDTHPNQSSLSEALASTESEERREIEKAPVHSVNRKRALDAFQATLDLLRP
jgi:hypothetical protein